REVFRLTGGTALSAFYLEHRLSEDLDFFSKENVPLNVLERFLRSISIIEDISFSKLFDRNIFNLKIKDKSFLKVEFTSSSLINIEDCVSVDQLIIDSFLDLTVNKLCAIADRFDAKDYVDVYCVLKTSDFSLRDLIELAEKKCDIKGIHHVLKSRLIQIPAGIDKLPLKVALSENEVKNFFEGLVRDIIAAEKI
ncbi:MAG: nucleotidyl transferase AbiEii/AbiGii toxin family protein, partial [candidate division Zixibacteria bacterium]|nr:nucleotidyl transferase AbiEii/AbiGii toxin family protein [candidate division Zixibacteria bacterium]